MNLKELGGKIVSKIKGKVDDIKLNADELSLLNESQTQFEDAKANYEDILELMDDRELIYLGTHDVDGNINNPTNPSEGRKKASNVRNVVYEFIETEVDNTNPQPVVKAKCQDNEWKAQMIEDSIKADLIDLNMERVNDQQERTTPIQGMSFFEVYWDNNAKTHTHVGELRIRLIHPKQVVPQPGVWDLKEMDYFFIISSVTKQYIKKRYDVDVEDEEESLPQINSIGDETYSRAKSPKVTEIVKWYKDDDGDVGRFVYVNNIVCENIPKYFYRRIDGKIVDDETLAVDIELRTLPNQSPQPQQPQGQAINQTQPQITPQPPQMPTVGQQPSEVQPTNIIKAGTKLPYFVPHGYPIVMRENIPVCYQFGGQSDIDVIRDQQDAIKKVVTKLQEKILKAGSLIILPDTQRGKAKLTDEELKVLFFDQAERATGIQVVSMQPDISKDMQFLAEQYNAAQSTLGITNSFQGKADTTAKSGVAKQLQIAQASGRMQSKKSNKYQAYKELFEIIFQFKLAFQDETRPYLTKDAQGNPAYEEFNRYEFLKQDETGEWYYDTDYIFASDESGGIPSDRLYMLDMVQNLYKEGALNKLQLWQQLENLHYPLAGDIKKQVEDTMYLQMYDKPKITIDFKDLPADAQVQLLQQIEIQTQGGLSPQLQVEVQKNQTDAQIKQEKNQNDIQLKQQDQQNNQIQTEQPTPIHINDLLSGLSPQEHVILQQNPEILKQFLAQNQHVKGV